MTGRMKMTVLLIHGQKLDFSVLLHRHRHYLLYFKIPSVASVSTAPRCLTDAISECGLTTSDVSAKVLNFFPEND